MYSWRSQPVAKTQRNLLVSWTQVFQC
jgi:hypothetical protein